MRLTLIGNGFMAQALAKGFIDHFEIEILGRDEEKIKKTKEEIPKIEAKVMSDVENINGKNIIFCVGPNDLQSNAARLEGEANILFSILTESTLDNLRNQIKSKYYIKVTPNIASSISKSSTAMTGDKEAKKLAMDLFNYIGKTLWVDTEKQLNIATAIVGGGPAFLSLVAESLRDGAIKTGLQRDISDWLIQGLFESFSELLKIQNPSLIKNSVMVPGGTTAAGLAKLEEGGVRNSMIKAIETAYNKAVLVD